MKYILIFIVLFLLFNSSFLFSQSQEPLSKEKYNIQFDSLSTVKSNLLMEKEALLVSIDSLKNYLIELEAKMVSGRADQLKRKYGTEIGSRIFRGQIWKGMTEQMLDDSWGKPEKITENKEKWGTFTQWYYGKITYFFKNGIMTGWEELK